MQTERTRFEQDYLFLVIPECFADKVPVVVMACKRCDDFFGLPLEKMQRGG